MSVPQVHHHLRSEKTEHISETGNQSSERDKKKKKKKKNPGDYSITRGWV